ncbi:MAG: hypothetical protein NTY22_07835 [Proteobacteria bacterium]|nr:hypothetical protein [Pseudomonadota bacterium]
MENNKALEGYELFDSFGKRFSRKITIRSNGVISLSAGIIKNYNIKKGTFAQILYNRIEKKIAIKFIQEKSDNAKKLVVQQHDDKVLAAWLNVRSFFMHNAIELPPKGKHFETKIEEENEDIIIFSIIK